MSLSWIYTCLERKIYTSFKLHLETSVSIVSSLHLEFGGLRIWLEVFGVRSRSHHYVTLVKPPYTVHKKRTNKNSLFKFDNDKLYLQTENIYSFNDILWINIPPLNCNDYIDIGINGRYDRFDNNCHGLNREFYKVKSII